MLCDIRITDYEMGTKKKNQNERTKVLFFLKKNKAIFFLNECDCFLYFNNKTVLCPSLFIKFCFLISKIPLLPLYKN